ncbi:DUF4157 domain-containing protein [Anabaena azotica FACHB-119]|uniref:DUF4157 domain-containing protein n=2 Tax=Anabaena azotica TaxID=197653 RepID=A0ABR8DBR2_9NOST|nr:DUF4157 domain-containing protein [Anabaena azotica FACHB-119]
MKPLDISVLQRQQAPQEEEQLQMKPLDISVLQRQQAPEEEEQLQMKPLDISVLQRQQAPQEEEQLQMKPLDISSLQRQQAPQEEEQLQMKPLDISSLQRQQAPQEEEQLQMKPMIAQRQGGGGMAATSDLETSINQARGGGQPLGDDIREPMEQAFGADFSGVKIHTDTQSDQLNRSIQARAFTTGQDVFFRQGEYSPGSRGGQELLAHELTHVVQQSGGMVQRSSQLQVQLGQHIATETPSASMSDYIIQKKFEGALEGITIAKLKEILPSYGITDEHDVQEIEKNFEVLKNHPLPIVSVPQLVGRVLKHKKNLTKEIATQVKEELITNAGKGLGEEAETVTLYRGDTRNLEQIKQAGGFFGRDHAPITIEHARQILQDWQSFTPKQKLDQAQAWKAQTKGKTDIVPYVATGEESQKGGNDYKIQVPMTFRGNEGDSEFTPKLGCDQWPIQSATILAIKMHGGEVIFLTGIPFKFIKHAS